MLDPVARLGDKISHSNAALGQLIGAAIGLTVGAAVVIGIAVATGGVGAAVAVPILAGCTVTGAGFGKWIGGGSSSETGEINEGASRTFVGPAIREVARYRDGIECADSVGALSWPVALGFGPAGAVAKLLGGHDGSFVNDGRFNVQVEGKLIAFLGAKTSCDGDVSKCIDGDAEAGRTLVDGPIVGILKRSELKGDNPALEWGLWVVDWGATIFGIKAASKIALPLTAGLLKGANQLSEKLLGAKHPATITLGLLSATVGLADAIIGSHTSTPDEAVAQGANVLVNGGLLGPDQVPKILDAAGGPTKELPTVEKAVPMIDAEREGLNTPWWVSWSGRTTK